MNPYPMTLEGVEEPVEIRIMHDELLVLVRLPVHPAALEVADSEAGESVDVVIPQVTGQVGTKSKSRTNAGKRALLAT